MSEALSAHDYVKRVRVSGVSSESVCASVCADIDCVLKMKSHPQLHGIGSPASSPSGRGSTAGSSVATLHPSIDDEGAKRALLLMEQHWEWHLAEQKHETAHTIGKLHVAVCN